MRISEAKEISPVCSKRLSEESERSARLAISSCVMPFSLLLSFSYLAISFCISIGIMPNSSRLIMVSIFYHFQLKTQENTKIL